MRERYKIRQTYDLLTIKMLHDKCFPSDEWYESETAVYWIAYINKKPVGFCILAMLDNDIAFLARVGVLPEARGNKLQIRMLRVREAYCNRNNFTKVITYTKIDNIASSHNLQKAGYFLYVPSYEYADEDCLYWIKDLSR